MLRHERGAHASKAQPGHREHAAVEQAKANRAALARPIVLAPYGPAQTGTWKSPITTDPFTIPIADKAEILLAANAAATAVRGVRFASSGVSFLREEKWFANSEGSFTEQVLYRCSPNMNVTAVAPDPITRTRLPVWSRSSGQNCGWTKVPSNRSSPGKSGRYPRS